jgi:hypothetical protein
MKRLERYIFILKIVYLLNLSLIFSACEKIDFNHNLIGDWNLYGTSAGTYPQFVPYSSFFMCIKDEYSYEFTKDNSVIEDGKYKLVKSDKSNRNIGEFSIIFIPDNRIEQGANVITDQPKIINISSSDLISLTDGKFDGFSFDFRRKKVTIDD